MKRLINGWGGIKLPKRTWKKFGRHAKRWYDARVDGSSIWFPDECDGEGYTVTEEVLVEILEAWLDSNGIVLDGKKYYFNA